MTQMTKKTAGVADVAGTSYIGVTRARVRVKTVIRESPATSATAKIASVAEDPASFLALDLGVFHREAHEVGMKEALGWSAVWLSCGLAFTLHEALAR